VFNETLDYLSSNKADENTAPRIRAIDKNKI